MNECEEDVDVLEGNLGDKVSEVSELASEDVQGTELSVEASVTGV